MWENIPILFVVLRCAEVRACCARVCCRISDLSGAEWGACRDFQTVRDFETEVFRLGLFTVAVEWWEGSVQTGVA